MAGSKKHEFCAQHAEEGMVDVSSKRCGHPSCTTKASYGVAGSKKTEFCARHTREGMMGACSTACGHPSCATRPSYGVASSNKAKFCAQHAQEGMVDIRSKRCGHPSCSTRPSYGVTGSKAEFCARHAQEGMVDICSKRCGHPGCTRFASYGVAGGKKPEFCVQHAHEGMVSVRLAGGSNKDSRGLQHARRGSEVDSVAHGERTRKNKKRSAPSTSTETSSSGRTVEVSKRGRQTAPGMGYTQALVSVPPDLLKTKALESVSLAAGGSWSGDPTPIGVSTPLGVSRCPLELAPIHPRSPPGGEGATREEVGVSR